MTKAEKIRRALLKYPKLKPKELAKKIGVSLRDVYNARYQMNKDNKANGYPHLETPEEKEAFDVACKSNNGEVVETDMVNHPPHYTSGGIETIDFIEAKGLNYHLGQVIKYVSRAGKKGDALEDLQKARWYLDREIGRVE
jgi:hypothetical protein